MRRAARTDTNQAEIVTALRAAGCSVLDLSRVGDDCPDILAGINGRNVLLEIKTETGKLSSGQRDFQRDWRGPVAVVRNVDQALSAMGADQNGLLRSRLSHDP